MAQNIRHSSIKRKVDLQAMNRTDRLQALKNMQSGKVQPEDLQPFYELNVIEKEAGQWLDCGMLRMIATPVQEYVQKVREEVGCRVDVGLLHYPEAKDLSDWFEEQY